MTVNNLIKINDYTFLATIKYYYRNMCFYKYKVFQLNDRYGNKLVDMTFTLKKELQLKGNKRLKFNYNTEIVLKNNLEVQTMIDIIKNTIC